MGDHLTLARRAIAAVPLNRWPEHTPVQLLMDGVVTSDGYLGGEHYEDVDREVYVVEWGDWHPLAHIPEALPNLGCPAGLGSLRAVGLAALADEAEGKAEEPGRINEIRERMAWGRRHPVAPRGAWAHCRLGGMVMSEFDYADLAVERGEVEMPADAVEALSQGCRCCSTCGDWPCAGVLAGGVCDQQGCSCDDEAEEDDDEG